MCVFLCSCLCVWTRLHTLNGCLLCPRPHSSCQVDSNAIPLFMMLLQLYFLVQNNPLRDVTGKSTILQSSLEVIVAQGSKNTVLQRSLGSLVLFMVYLSGYFETKAHFRNGMMIYYTKMIWVRDEKCVNSHCAFPG